MKDLYLVRHGQTLFNLKTIIQGWCDSPLTPLGVEQARRAGAFLRARGIAPDAAYTSTLHRTEETIRALWPDLAYERLDDLREWSFGDYEAERVLLMPERPWRDFFRPFGGEGQFEVRERVAAALTQVMGASDVETVLAVSHGSAIREFLIYTAGPDADEACTVPGNCATLHFEFDPAAAAGTCPFTLVETFTQDDYARELGLGPLPAQPVPQRG